MPEKDYYYVDQRYLIKLNSFMEDVSLKVLMDKSTVIHKAVHFRTERYFSVDRDLHCFVFICISEGKIVKPFAKKPSDVIKLIKEGKLKIDKLYNLE